jgi:carboxylesterase
VPDVLPGAEPASFPGGPHGVLVLHGFTGSPQGLRGLAQAFADAGFATELPRLPGHGTSAEDLATTGWADWSAAADAAYQDLASRCDKVVVAGLSMGGALAAWLAANHSEIAGLVLVNPAVEPMGQDAVDLFRQMLAGGTEYIPGIAGDIAEEGQTELSYEMTPVRSLLSLIEQGEALATVLSGIACPTILFTSPQDHVVPPSASEYYAERVSGPVERVTLERSYHVATLDYDRHDIEKGAVEFALRVTSE